MTNFGHPPDPRRYLFYKLVTNYLSVPITLSNMDWISYAKYVITPHRCPDFLSYDGPSPVSAACVRSASASTCACLSSLTILINELTSYCDNLFMLLGFGWLMVVTLLLHYKDSEKYLSCQVVSQLFFGYF